MFDILKKQKAVLNIPIDEIAPNPFQPRREFDEDELKSLGQSIAEHGQIQPVAVRKTEKGYELIAGERRLRASLLAGLTKIDAVVYEADDEKAAVWALLENLQRSDLNPFEEAAAMAALIKTWKIPREEGAKRLGIAPSTLSNKLRLLKLNENVKRIIIENSLTERHARELLRIEDLDRQIQTAGEIAKKGLNVPETVRYIDRILAEKPKGPAPKYIVKDLRIFINTFEHAVEVMNFAGLKAVSTVTENEEMLIYSVSVPKNRAFKRKD